jgi:predicted RNase H-like HicB family nuclease
MDLVFLVHRDEDGGYWAEAVGHGIFTQGDDLDELKFMIEDATELYFEDPAERPQNILWRFVDSDLAA